MTVQQLVVDLENEPGRLFSVTEAIAQADVLVYALTLSDGGDTGTARILVSDVKRARAAVMGLDVPARTEDVLLLAAPHRPSSLSELLEPLFDDYVNVIYLNSFADKSGSTIAVIRFSDNERAREILRAHGHVPRSLSELFAASAPEPGTGGEDESEVDA